MSDINEVLDIIGFGRMQTLMLFTCCMCHIHQITEIMELGMAALTISCEFSLSKLEISMLTSAGLLGMILSAHYSGYKSDIMGRRAVLLRALVFSILTSVLSVAMPYFYPFILCRFLNGLFLTPIAVNSMTYLMEYSSMRLHARLANCFTIASAIQSLLVVLVAHLLKPMNMPLFVVGQFKVSRWRLYMLFNIVSGSIGAVLMYFLPESAKFLNYAGNPRTAYETLNRLCLHNRGQDLDSLGVERLLTTTARPSLFMKINIFKRIWRDTVPLFRAPYVKFLLVIIFVLCVNFGFGNGLSLKFVGIHNWVTNNGTTLCFELSHYDSNASCNENINYLYGMALGLASLSLCLLLSLVLIYANRRLVIFATSFTAGLCGFTLNFAVHQITQLIVLTLLIMLCISSFTIIASVIADHVPTQLRAKAFSLAYMCSRTAFIAVNYTINYMLFCDCYAFFNIFTGLIISIAIIVLFMPI